jgi:hypothetical protein
MEPATPSLLRTRSWGPPASCRVRNSASTISCNRKSRDNMNSRPLSVTLISCLFIAAGAIGFAYHVTEFKQGQVEYDLVLVCFVRLLAILAGLFMLRGRNWARWLLLVWIVYHVILSAFHSLSELAMHSLLFGVVAYFLFRPQASAYFRAARAPHPGPK